MEVSIKNSSCESLKGDCLVVGVYKDEITGNAANSLPSTAIEKIYHALKSKFISGKCGETLFLGKLDGVAANNVLIVGLGSEGKVSRDNYIKANNSAHRACLNLNLADLVNSLCLENVTDCSLTWKVRQSSFSAASANYRFDQCKSKSDDAKKKIRKVHLVLAAADKSAQTKAAAEQGVALAAGVSLTRDLGNLPGNICTPSYLAEQAEDLAKEWKMKCTVLDKKDMLKLGMGSLLSVAQGSQQPPKLITLEYNGGDKNQAPIVLVGKGITFDSGGISLKPGAEMDEMKFDMCGAASVFGTLRAIAEMKLSINVVGIIPTTENMPSGTATRPGDIVSSMSGQTIEILNTDAEGRLILCDALSYAAKFKPKMVIDIATLTGACVVALGHVAAGLFANQQHLADELLASSQLAEDRAWQLPLWDEYQELLDSNFADIANIGGRWGGSITAACFLARFTKEYTWAHLDIAGVAWKSGKEKGATGRPVPLLTHFLLEKAGEVI